LKKFYIWVINLLLNKKSSIMVNDKIQIPFSIIERFAQCNGVTLEVSQGIYEKVLDFLDVCDAADEKAGSPSKVVDEAWHSFILHTKLYAEFCENRYGSFIHHFPRSNAFDPNSKLNALMQKESLKSSDLVSKCGSSSDCGNSD
jgi:hypothetical protein